TFPALPALQGAGPVVVPLFTAEESVVVAGIPHAKMTVSGGPDSILHFSLLAQTARGVHVVDDQATGYRVKIPLGQVSTTVELDLAGVATRLAPGDTLLLRVEPANEWYATNGNRVPGAVVLTDVTVTIPTVDA
ncbi:MAG TPA: hypothetical protein VNZ52_15055, partial [Candidatus Thermoplasmatota archaeon]|nr:hypothetical protein [Candidatus Thermoplasmatota archaeon]